MLGLKAQDIGRKVFNEGLWCLWVTSEDIKMVVGFQGLVGEKLLAGRGLTNVTRLHEDSTGFFDAFRMGFM